MEKKAIKYAAGSSKRDIPMRKGKTQATKKYLRGSFRKENYQMQRKGMRTLPRH